MLGIALVVEDANHGQRLAFRYPATSRVGQGSNTERDQKDTDKHDNNPYAWLGKDYEEEIYGVNKMLRLPATSLPFFSI